MQFLKKQTKQKTSPSSQGCNMFAECSYLYSFPMTAIKKIPQATWLKTTEISSFTVWKPEV